VHHSGLTGPALPRERWLAVLTLAALLPLLLRFAGQNLGSFGMFTGFERCRLHVLRRGADGSVAPLLLARLAPHLGRDARRVILPAEEGATGETQVGLLAGGLDDLARLACAVDAGAISVELRLERSRLDGRALPGASASRSCRDAAR
jgi:hypothetical protein